MRQERAAAPLYRMVQAPQTPCSHPRCVPVRLSSSRRKSASVMRPETACCGNEPLTGSRMLRVASMLCVLLGLVEILATVDMDRLAGNVARLFRSEKNCQISHVFRDTHAPQGYLPSSRLEFGLGHAIAGLRRVSD